MGTGPSKQIAKNICAEHCIQYIVTKRCTESKNKAAEAVKQAAAAASATPAEGADNNGAAASSGAAAPAVPEGLKPHEMTDETPWAQLASLALFKLFNDWQAQGFAIPAELFKSPDYFNNQGTAPPMKVKFIIMLVPCCVTKSYIIRNDANPGPGSVWRCGDEAFSTTQHAVQEGSRQPDFSSSCAAPQRAPWNHQLSAG